MIRRTISAVVVLGTLVSVWHGTARPALAQPVLERLEQRIRDRLNRTERRVNPPQNHSGETPERAAAGQPAENAGTKANKEPGYLGIVVDDKNDRGRGVRVLEVKPGGPADEGGLRKQDLITGAAGIRVRQMSDMADVLDLFFAGDSVSFDILRGEKRQTIKVTLARRPPPPAEPSQPPEIVPRPPVVEMPPEAPAEVPDAAGGPDENAKQPPTTGPQLQPPETPSLPAEAPTETEQLRGRIEQLERRVAELERALTKALGNRGRSTLT